MKTFRNVVVVKQPLEALWCAVRDRLPEIAERLDDIESVTAVEREDIAPDRVRLVNEWRSTQQVPPAFRERLGATSVAWLDRNEWDEASRRCSWLIEPSLLADHVRCAGVTAFEPTMGGRGTRVTFSGEFELVGGAFGSLAGALERPALATVESVVTVLIPRNLRKVMTTAGELIHEAPSG